MRRSWPSARLGDVVERIAMGPFGSSIKVDTFVPAGVPIISGAHLHNFRLNDEAGFKFITPKHADQLKNANVTHGDIVLTHRGTIGQVTYIPKNSKFERYVISQSQFSIRCDRSKLLPEFVVAYFKTAEGQHKLLANASQVGVPSIAQPVTYLRKVEVPLPSIPEQYAIVHFLEALNDKIDLDHLMSQTLEEMARSVFKSWFIDFDPVRAKAEGRRPCWMKADVAELFPSSFAKSSGVPIPEGWEAGPMTDIADLNPENWTKETRPLTFKYVDLANTKWGCIEAVTEFQAAEAPSRAQRVLRTGDTIVGTVRPGNGSYAFVFEDGLTGSTGFAVLRPRKQEYKAFVYLGTTRRENIERLAHVADGGAYPAVRPDVVGRTEIVYPGNALAARFAAIVDPLFERIALCLSEASVLGSLRDTLLPKLLSGELRIKDAKKMVAQAS